MDTLLKRTHNISFCTPNHRYNSHMNVRTRARVVNFRKYFGTGDVASGVLGGRGDENFSGNKF